MKICAVCEHQLKVAYTNPLDFEKRFYCWEHADYYYSFHQERKVEEKFIQLQKESLGY